VASGVENGWKSAVNDVKAGANFVETAGCQFRGNCHRNYDAAEAKIGSWIVSGLKDLTNGDSSAPTHRATSVRPRRLPTASANGFCEDHQSTGFQLLGTRDRRPEKHPATRSIVECCQYRRRRCRARSFAGLE
jgi:hypothetical protein